MEYALQALTEQLELKYYSLSLLHNRVCNSCGQSRPVLWGGFVSMKGVPHPAHGAAVSWKKSSGEQATHQENCSGRACAACGL